MAFDWEAHTGHCRHFARATSGGDTDLFRTDGATCGLHTFDHAIHNIDACYFTLLDQIDTALVCSAGKAPSHRIVTRRATTGMIQAAVDWEACLIKI